MQSDSELLETWETRVQALLDDPIVHQIMAYDGIDAADVLAVFREVARKCQTSES